MMAQKMNRPRHYGNFKNSGDRDFEWSPGLTSAMVQTCLEGYRQAAAMGAAYVLQIDSDGQCDPRYFSSLWRLREQFTVVNGVRATRDDGLARVFVSRVLLLLLVAFRVNCRDANSPYRLMMTDSA
jgi:hypothetical protein